MQAPRPLAQLAKRVVTQRNYASLPHKVTTLNDMPTPQGSWKTHYDAKQRKYNAQLLLGIGALVGTIIFGKSVGYLEFYNDIPDRPAVIENYKTYKQ